MSNSSPTFDALVQSQASKEITVNAFFDAASPATLYGRRQSTTTALYWGYYGGNVLINGVLTQISNGVITMAGSATNYLQANPSTGAVTVNTSGFTAGFIPLYTIVTAAFSVTSYTDHRLATPEFTGRLALAMADANTTLTQAHARNQIIEFTGTLTATRNIVLPMLAQQWTVFNNTTGGLGLQFIGASGTGVTVGAGKRAIIYADGTNIVRATADV